jgi:thymidylate synthase
LVYAVFTSFPPKTLIHKEIKYTLQGLEKSPDYQEEPYKSWIASIKETEIKEEERRKTEGEKAIKQVMEAIFGSRDMETIVAERKMTYRGIIQSLQEAYQKYSKGNNEKALINEALKSIQER